jgi:hypothetical protein
VHGRVIRSPDVGLKWIYTRLAGMQHWHTTYFQALNEVLVPRGYSIITPDMDLMELDPC